MKQIARPLSAFHELIADNVILFHPDVPPTFVGLASWLNEWYARHNPPRCWCNAAMTFIGFGAYPYACEAQDKWPTAAIYHANSCGHSCWSINTSFTGGRT